MMRHYYFVTLSKLENSLGTQEEIQPYFICLFIHIFTCQELDLTVEITNLDFYKITLNDLTGALKLWGKDNICYCLAPRGTALFSGYGMFTVALLRK